MCMILYVKKDYPFNAGPTVGGILFDAVTFRWAIMFIVALEFIAFILLALFLLKAVRDIYGTLVKLTANPF